MAAVRVLVADQRDNVTDRVREILGKTMAEVVSVKTVDTGRAISGDYDVVLMDYPEHENDSYVREAINKNPRSRIIVMSEHAPDVVAVKAMQLGAFDYIAKPLHESELRMRVERALRMSRFEKSPAKDKKRARKPRKSDVIVGSASWIKDLYESIAMVAPTDTPVAVYGESGTGKELVARTIHNLSDRFERPFVVVNCAAIPEGLLEDELFGHVRGAFTDASKDREGLFWAADGGTLFLDEIGEMAFPLQAKLLRVVQNQEFRRIGSDSDVSVDVRFVTATNKDLEKSVSRGEFREDLYYRINVFPLTIPPLRERPEDIPLLAHHFLLSHRGRIGKKIDGFTTAAMKKICSYDYPGNVRELENKVHQAMVMAQGDWIGPNDVMLRAARPLEANQVDITRPFRELKKQTVESFESNYTHAILKANEGNLAAAARQAGMDRKNLWSLARKYGVDVHALRERAKEC